MFLLISMQKHNKSKKADQFCDAAEGATLRSTSSPTRAVAAEHTPAVTAAALRQNTQTHCTYCVLMIAEKKDATFAHMHVYTYLYTVYTYT